ncbi:methylated-DNA--[protein]-cysteine S-methyltransferase [Erysipelotrichaceae bacterium OttesenSCG-928-M19]|nr:methylated-DNA--[protein]-cysteine S-methyltransferase [Erysipelotrichaceae bacterium OttesenSCG-928-M19]
MIYATYYQSMIGRLLLASDGENIIGLWMDQQKYYKASYQEEFIENNELAIFIKAKQWLDDYFSGKKPELSQLSLKPKGTEFQQDVWQILCEIPYGTLSTYGEIAKKIAAKKGLTSMSAQAVGGAVGHNPISVIIPCHRVVGSNGSLTGFAGGIDKKVKLLELENVALNELVRPTKGSAL